MIIGSARYHSIHVDVPFALPLPFFVIVMIFAGASCLEWRHA